MKSLLSAMMAFLAFIMTSCGGAGGVGSGGTGFSGTQIGAVTGFGSVIVEGNTYQETGAAYFRAKDPGSPVSVTSDSLRLGMQVELSYTSTTSGEQARTITIKPTVIGTIQSVAADSVTVAGQRVRLTSAPAQATVFENFASFSSLATGMSVEVHGSLNAAGEIIATRIELLSASPSSDTRLTGVISAIQTLTGGTVRLSIGSLFVDVDSRTSLTQTSGGTASTLGISVLAVGQRVTVFASSATGTSTLAASSLQVEAAPAVSAQPLRIGGIISALNSSTSFSIGAVSVDASQAQFSSGTVADLVMGKQVRVLGTTTTGGILKATQVQFISSNNDLKAELSGSISDFVSSGSFRIRNTVIDASAATVAFSGGSAAMLANDVFVKVEGVLAGNQIIASKVTFSDSSDNRYRAYVGKITSYVAGTGMVTIQGINGHLSASTVYTLNDGTSTTLADVIVGADATMRGLTVNGVFEISAIEIDKPAQTRLVKTKGGAYEVNLSAKTLKVNGLMVTWNASTQIDGSLSNLTLGYIAEVEGTLNNGVIVAQRLKVTKP